MRGYPCFRDLLDFGLKLIPSEVYGDHFIICDPSSRPLCDKEFYKNDLVSDGWIAFFNIALRDRGFSENVIKKER